MGGIGFAVVVSSKFSPSQRIVPFCNHSTTIVDSCCDERKLRSEWGPNKAASMSQESWIESKPSLLPLNLIVNVDKIIYGATDTFFHPLTSPVSVATLPTATPFHASTIK